MRNEVPVSLAKKALDDIMRKARVDFYKPIHIAETLRAMRLDDRIMPQAVESYRNESRRWRDEVTIQLIGKRSTSSARYQDDVWNAMPADKLDVLKRVNNESAGGVEAYIYDGISLKLQDLHNAIVGLHGFTADTFDAREWFQSFSENRNLRKSVDRVLEVFVSVLLKHVLNQARVTVTVDASAAFAEAPQELLALVESLTNTSAATPRSTVQADVYGGGKTNSADAGVDLWANFGPAIQIKHELLTIDRAEQIGRSVSARTVVIVCKVAHQDFPYPISTLFVHQHQEFIVLDLSFVLESYASLLRLTSGPELFAALVEHMDGEFPAAVNLPHFFTARGYGELAAPAEFA